MTGSMASRTKNPSLKRKILLFLGLGLAFTFAALLTDYLLSNRLLREETVYQYRNMLKERIQTLDGSLKSEAALLVIFANNNSNAMDLKRAGSYEEYYFPAVRARNDLDILYSAPLSETAFFIREIGGASYHKISKYSSFSARESKALEDHITGLTLEEAATQNRWKLVSVGDQWYFRYGFSRDNCAYGLCIRAERLLDSLGLERVAGSFLTVLNDGGEAAASAEMFSGGGLSEERLTSMENGFMASGSSLALSVYSESLARPVYYVRENTFSDNMEKLILLLYLTAFLIAVIFFTAFSGSFYSVFQSLRILKLHIAEVKNGQLQTAIEVSPGTPQEFAEAYQLFNEMTVEIKNLKISSYEAELEKQRFEIQFLSMQIEPHFYLNSMKYLYALAQRKQYGTVQRLLIGLSRHFRYLTYDSQKLVTLAEELEHTENYLSIIVSGTQNKIETALSVSPRAERVLVPKLFVQTFVENAVKYAVQEDGSLKLEVTIDVLGAGDPYLSMIIQDNGKGFSEEYLQKIEKYGFTDQEKHIGLSNLYHRLQLLFGEQIYLNVSNPESGGAMIEVLIPARTDEDPAVAEEGGQE